MNIQELDAYNLDDAVKFNDRLNPALWDRTEHLKPEIKAQLLLIAEDFRESLGIKDLDLKDITISGSNAAYTYTPNSDIDLHLVVDQPEDPVFRELFDAKKAQYNDTHSIKIKGFDVEVYVEAADKPPISQGTYSILQDKWTQVPKRQKATVDDHATKNKFETVGHAVERAVKSGDRELMDSVARKIKRMRQTGLEAHGEFGPENLAFKMLRSQGVLKQLHDARVEAKNAELSLKERRPVRSVFTYGFKHEDVVNEVGLTPDGVSPHTCMIVDAAEELSDEEILKDFIDFCGKELKLKHMPVIKLRKDPQWPVVHKTFGRYTNDKNLLEVAWGSRHIMDVLRTVAHELTHRHQHERDGEQMGNDAGETGSPWENEANARAGILMRDYARLHPDYFAAGQAEELHGDEIAEGASGYIPTKKQAKDPRYVMALTKDVRPGAVGKEANKLKLRTNSQGQPQIANPNGLFERLQLELEQFKRKGTVVESEQLDEVRMAASNLKQFANSPEAEGIQCGFEAELIFRDTTSDENGDGDGDMEPDYDADERCSSLSQIVEFFEGGEYGYLSPRQRNALEEELDEKYYEWRDEQMYQEWADERDELIRDAFLEEQSMAYRIHAVLVDGMELTDEQADAIQAVGDLASKGLKGSEMSEEQLDMFMTYKEAKSDAEEILSEEVESCISSEDGFYDTVLDDFRDRFEIDDDSGFFDDVGLRYMTDVAQEFDLDWPYMMGSGGNGGERDWDSIGDSLHEIVGMPVKVSSGYHSATRKPGLWIVEPDSSLDPDDREDYGLEIVSPPMPLKQALEQLEAVTNWANDPSEGNAYTNSSTGLHMGVSIPYKEGRVDYLKLILFLGDEYVLKSFGRESNTYTRAAMNEIRSKAGNERNAQAVMDLLRSNLLELAERELVRSTGEGKYTSAHKQGKYIEFRSAGGDWLAEGDAEPGKLENTMMRYAYAMYLAGRPDLERKEYYKKLYKLITPAGDDPIMNLFSQYASGAITTDGLKKEWAKVTLNKEQSSTKKSNWSMYDKISDQPIRGFEFNNYTEDEAWAKAAEKLNMSVEALKRGNKMVDKNADSTQWEIYRDDHGKEEQLEIIDAATRSAAVDAAYDKYTGVIPFKVRPYYGDDAVKSEPTKRAQLARQIAQRPAQAPKEAPADVAQNFNQPTGLQQAVDGTGEPIWEIVRRSDNQVEHEISAENKDQAESNIEDPDKFYVRPKMEQPTQASTNPRPTAPINNQALAANGVPIWQLFDVDTMNAVHELVDHTSREAYSRGMAWLQSVGAEDPATYGQRFAIRPKMQS